jgi:hypothetical protein
MQVDSICLDWRAGPVMQNVKVATHPNTAALAYFVVCDPPRLSKPCFELRGTRRAPPLPTMVGLAGRVMTETEQPDRIGRIETRLDALSAAMNARFEQVNERFDEVDERFEGVDRRFEEVDKRFEGIDKQFREVQEHFVEQRGYSEFVHDRLDRRMTEGFSRLERKLDQVIDAQSRPKIKATPRRRARPSKRRR